MDLKQLRYFVMVAEELSFSKAATRLHMSQPPLSQQIKSLEEDMGVALFVRNRREVSLTEAGAVFLRECRPLLEQFHTAVNVAVHASQANVGTLRLGVATSGLFSVMPTFLKLMRSEFPNVEVRISDMQSDDQVLALAQGSLDMGIVHVRPERLNLARHPIYSDGLCVVLPQGHRHAGQPTVSLTDLVDEPMIALSRAHAPTVFDAVIASCAAAGFSPRIQHTARSPFTIFQMVQMGFGIALVPCAYRSGAYPGVVLRDLPETGVGRIRLELIWNERKGSPFTQRVALQLAPRLQAELAELGSLRPPAP